MRLGKMNVLFNYMDGHEEELDGLYRETEVYNTRRKDKGQPGLAAMGSEGLRLLLTKRGLWDGDLELADSCCKVSTHGWLDCLRSVGTLYLRMRVICLCVRV